MFYRTIVNARLIIGNRRQKPKDNIYQRILDLIDNRDHI
jgi:hypothetical protein